MKIKTQYRVILLMLALLAAAAIGLFVLSQSEKRHTETLYQDVVDERQRLFSAVYRLDGEPQANLATDYTYWDDMVAFVKKPTKKFAQDNLDTALSTYQVDAIWVFRTDGTKVYQNNGSNVSAIDLPLSKAEIAQVFTKQRLAHFFVRTSSGIVEIRAATIHPSNDPNRQTVPQGYFFVGRLYNAEFRQRLGNDSKSNVNLLSGNDNPTMPDPSTGQVVIDKTLGDMNGQTIARLQATADAPSIRELYTQNSQRVKNFVIIVIPVLLALLWFLTRYVTNPLNKISRTLATKDPNNLEELGTSTSEFGQIALLLSQYFRQNRQQLEEAHTRLRASINAFNIGFIMTDANLNITMVNDAARRILFADPKRAKEVKLAELERLMPKIKLEQTISNAINTITSHSLGEVPLLEKFLRIYVAPVTESPGQAPVIGSIILFEDITLERSLKRARDEFFSIASHELRTPLTVIMGNAAMIAEHVIPKVKNPELAGMTKDIYDSSRRLIQMVNDFLDTSRLEQNRIKFELTAVDLPELLQGLVKEYQHTVGQQGLELKLEILDGRGKIVARADQIKLRQVLINLLSNAVTFTHSGSITMRLESHPDYVRIFVTDTGEGIPPERHNLLFKKFQQAEENILSRATPGSLKPGSARDTTHGTGLGLYISKMLMEGMGGLIRLESSEPGKGTTFSLTLPAAKPSKLKKGE
ncbi:MAG TPA: ATP-binding protein [Candidatus Saccharimonadales bacterium]|nr:ATP-binding protein [Candidatus Saccharimonadales bacterium]